MKLVFYSFFSLLVLCATDIYAQDSVGNIDAKIQPQDNVFIDGFANDLMTIQQQNALIQMLIERQSQIAKLALHYENMGIPYTQPKPPLSVCQSLPQNLLCLLHYPELDNNKAATDAIKASIQSTIAQNMQKALDAFQFNTGNVDLSQNTTGLTFQWDDIQCLRGECSALLVPVGYKDRRYRVVAGDELMNGIKVASISPSEVVILNKDQRIVLDPTSVIPSQDDDVTPDDTLSELLDEKFGSETAGGETPTSDVSPPAVSAVTGNMAQPVPESTNRRTLGPTGLF